MLVFVLEFADFRRFVCLGPKGVCYWRRLVFGLICRCSGSDLIVVVSLSLCGWLVLLLVITKHFSLSNASEIIADSRCVGDADNRFGVGVGCQGAISCGLACLVADIDRKRVSATVSVWVSLRQKTRSVRQ